MRGHVRSTNPRYRDIRKLKIEPRDLKIEIVAPTILQSKQIRTPPFHVCRPRRARSLRIFVYIGFQVAISTAAFLALIPAKGPLKLNHFDEQENETKMTKPIVAGQLSICPGPNIR